MDDPSTSSGYEYKSPSAWPVAKVTSGGVAGAVVFVLIWILQSYGGVEVPAEVAAALTTVLSFGASYYTPPQGLKS